MTINVMLDNGAYAPEKAHNADAGFDLRTPKIFCVDARQSAKIDTGVHIQIPDGYVGFLKSKSGLNVKHGLTGTGVIDAGYTGSIVVKLYNNSDTNYCFEAGHKIIQLVILPIPEVNIKIVDNFEKNFADSDRENKGFGSSGL